MTTPTSGPDDRFADLAETILTVAREIRLREYDSEGTIALTPSNAQVMRYIDAHPGSTPSETAEATGLLRSNLSTGVRELEKIGFLERRQDPEDGRGVRLYSTPLAAEGLARVRSQWADDAGRVLGRSRGVAEATALLKKLAAGLVEERRASGTRWSRRQL